MAEKKGHYIYGFAGSNKIMIDYLLVVSVLTWPTIRAMDQCWAKKLFDL